MTVFVERPPQSPVTLEDEQGLSADELTQVAERFQSSTVGSYTWNYVDSNRRIRRLYELGKARNWNAETDIDWSPQFERHEQPMSHATGDPYAGWHPYESLSDAEKITFKQHQYAWTLSQFLHGEQGALLVASQLVSCAPTHAGKLYAASQAFDEARHVEALSRYLYSRLKIVYPVNAHLKVLLDKLLTDPRWDLKFIGMQLIVEALALAAFDVQIQVSRDPVLRQVLRRIMSDESRHVAFGLTYMEEIVRSLSETEVSYRARFALEACRIMQDRIVPVDLYAHYATRGFSVEEGRRRFLDAGGLRMFRNLLFARVMPNLKRIGLVTDEVAPGYEALGLLRYADGPCEVDWNTLEGDAEAPPTFT